MLWAFAMPFTPPAAAVQSAVRPRGDDWYSCGWRALDAWRSDPDRQWSYARLADALGCAQGGITGWKNGRPPSGLHLDRIEALAGIPREAWTWWVQDEPLDATERPSSPPPESEKRAAGPVPLGSTREELQASIRRLDKLAASDIPPKQRADIEGKRVTAVIALARLEERQAIVDHPDFAPLVEDLVAAVRAALGPDAPDGIESRIADEFERLQAARATTADRRAA